VGRPSNCIAAIICISCILEKIVVSLEKIFEKFALLDEYLGSLKKIAKTPIDKFLNDKILIGSAKYYLQVSIECCLDVANHIIAAEKFRVPQDYADSFKVLEEQALVPEDLGKRLQQMAKFRNRLVHLYGTIDDSNVHKYINKDVKNLVKFKSIVIERYGK
jgi:uncharacterized protein YutE (UPF0331/DUF86 family)